MVTRSKRIKDSGTAIAEESMMGFVVRDPPTHPTHSLSLSVCGELDQSKASAMNFVSLSGAGTEIW